LLHVLAELREREPLFHTGHAAEQIAAPTFWEVGASGRRYSREYVLDALSSRMNWRGVPPSSIIAAAAACRRPSTAHNTYRTT
jgi:hypothetical protein